MGLKVLLLSAYHAKSHEYWAENLMQQLSNFQWQHLQLAPRFFAWRVRGNPISWFEQLAQLDLDKIDLLIATSMCDLACIKGLHPALANTPSIVYFHENQFAYPNAEKQQLLEAKMVSIYNALAADCIVFNSQFNQRTFLQGAAKLLQKMPDQVPSSVIETIKAKCQQLSVPIINAKTYLQSTWQTGQVIELVWNHRWEYDKAPDRLLLFLQILKQQHINFKIAIIGQRFRQQPAAFEQIQQQFADNLSHFGFVDRQQYWSILQRSHIVLSTALHDFQGLAVMEACQCGAVPLVPNRQAYSQWFSEQYCYTSFVSQPQKEAQAMFATFMALLKTPTLSQQRVDLHKLSIDNLRQDYHQLCQQIVSSA